MTEQTSGQPDAVIIAAAVAMSAVGLFAIGSVVWIQLQSIKEARRVRAQQPEKTRRESLKIAAARVMNRYWPLWLAFYAIWFGIVFGGLLIAALTNSPIRAK